MNVVWINYCGISISGLGIATLCIGLLFRMLVSFLAVLGTQLNMKERIFIPFAWLPKATVQVCSFSLQFLESPSFSNPII